MSRSSAPQRNAKLTVVACDPMAEIFVIDWKLNRVARGVNRLETEQPPGIYKVKVRVGQTTHEELAVLRDADLTVEVPQLSIPTAIPLANSSLSHEYHQAAVLSESEKPRVKLGNGASILVIARDWTPQDKEVNRDHHPAKGLELRTAGDQTLVRFEDVAHTDMTLDPVAVCNVRVDPGSYVLSVTVATGEIFEMSVVASRGWQTRVFLLQRDSQAGRGRFPDLRNSSIQMARMGESFRENDVEARMTEVARLALIDDRSAVATEAIDYLLRSKLMNPMLGILGGLLLARAKDPDLSRLAAVVDNLRSVAFQSGEPHPDVEALALLLPGGQKTSYRFHTPPMFRQNWRYLVEASVKLPALVPSGSLSASMASAITNQEPWLIWRSPGSNEASKPNPFLAELKEYVSSAGSYSVAELAPQLSVPVNALKAMLKTLKS